MSQAWVWRRVETNVLNCLTLAPVTYCCLWDVSRSVKLRPSLLSDVGFSRGSDRCGVGNGQVATKCQHIADIDTDTPAHASFRPLHV